MATSASSSISTPASTTAPIDHHQLLREKYQLPSSSYVEDELDPEYEAELSAGFEDVKRDETSWAGGLPQAQGLYDPENEKDVSVCQLVLLSGIVENASASGS